MTPYEGLPIYEQKGYCVMLLKQLNKTPSDISVEKDMLKRMVIKLFTEDEGKWALTFFEFERILRIGYNAQMALMADLKLSGMVLPQDRSNQGSSRNRRDDSGKSRKEDSS